MIPTVKDIANLPVDKLPPLVHVPPLTKPFDVTIRPPGSKSLTNRALLLAALADGESVLTGALADADDAQVMVRALRQLGAEIEVTPEVEPNGESCGNATIRVKGVAGRWKIKPGETVTLNLNNAGTATRFLTAAAVLQPPESGGIVIDGNARMRERPIGELVDGLRAMGVHAEYLGRQGCPPVKVEAPATLERLEAEVALPCTQSSQFVSGLLLVAAFLPRGLMLHLQKPVTSEHYIELTLDVMSQAGVRPSSGWPHRAGCRTIKVWPIAERLSPPIAPGTPAATAAMSIMPLPAFGMKVPVDPSGKAFPSVAALLSAGSLIDAGLEGALELQPVVPLDISYRDPDEAMSPEELRQFELDWPHLKMISSDQPNLAHALYRLGLRSANDGSKRERGPERIDPMNVSLKQIPDETMALTVGAAFASGGSEFRGLRTLRVKETDRIAALITELAKVGVSVQAFDCFDEKGNADEGIRITPPAGGIDCSPSAPRVEFDTYDDHRMAMSLALIGLRRPNVYIRDPGCVRKTYPTFWRDLAKLYG